MVAPLVSVARGPSASQRPDRAHRVRRVCPGDDCPDDRAPGGRPPLDHRTVLGGGHRGGRAGAVCSPAWDGLVSAHHLGDGGVCALDRAPGRTPPRPATVKKMPQGSTQSSLTAFRTSRGLVCREVSGRCGTSSGVLCGPRSSAWSACSPGLPGAVGTKGSRNIGTTNDVQFHNYNCSTRQQKALGMSMLGITLTGSQERRAAALVEAAPSVRAARWTQPPCRSYPVTLILCQSVRRDCAVNPPGFRSHVRCG